MGVPAFFRWLSRKYPSIIVHCVEMKAQTVGGHTIPVDSTQPNPNEVEFDNLYLDMNGIIHPCCHPEDRPAPKDEDEMMAAIFEYIDRIFNIIRPRRLLYMAIDGVAPRAKMNQQRSRRFRASKESIEKLESISEKRAEIETMGIALPPPVAKEAHFDSNCITPGTEFMARLAVCLQYYVHERLNHNIGWQGVKVILSDANVPGEGEHKIMDYIRKQRGQPDHDPNTHHCLYGADADLIMLGLATHEPHFTILREEFKPNQNQSKPCEICGQLGHTLKECTGEARKKEGEFDELANSGVTEKEFIFIRLCVLREYLERELRIDGLPFPFDLERAIDDWVFMCFFVGNDFLPHLPSLEIREGAIDKLIRLYKQVVPQTHGYLTYSGRVNLPRVQMILTELGKIEDDTFRNRRQRDQDYRRRNKEKKRRENNYGGGPSYMPGGQFAPMAIGRGYSTSPVTNPRQEAYQMRTNQNAAADLKKSLKESRQGGQSSSGQSSSSQVAGQKRQKVGDDSDSEPEDSVRLWEEGWKERYYQDKFGVPSDDVDFVDRITEQYTQGLCWVLGYYYQGCPSWKWFYPFHYAPFASDFKNIKKVRNDFDKGTTPFHPLEQLMGVFPESSGTFIPKSWRVLMGDENSPIIDFYPTNFKIDLNGKKYAWQGVALLPFVDEDRLHKALAPLYPNLTPDEKQRNSLGADRLFIHDSHRLHPLVCSLYEEEGEAAHDQEVKVIEINPEFSNGVRGVISCDPRMSQVIRSGGVVESQLPEFPSVQKTHAVGCIYKDPAYSETHLFEAMFLPGINMPDRVLRGGGRGRSSWRSPQTGFVPRPDRSYSTPESAKRTIQHSLSDPRQSQRGRGQSPSQRGRGYSQDKYSRSYSSGGDGGGQEMYSSQGASHGFRGQYDGGSNYEMEHGNYSDGYYSAPPSRANWHTPSQPHSRDQRGGYGEPSPRSHYSGQQRHRPYDPNHNNSGGRGRGYDSRY